MSPGMWIATTTVQILRLGNGSTTMLWKSVLSTTAMGTLTRTMCQRHWLSGKQCQARGGLRKRHGRRQDSRQSQWCIGILSTPSAKIARRTFCATTAENSIQRTGAMCADTASAIGVQRIAGIAKKNSVVRVEPGISAQLHVVHALGRRGEFVEVRKVYGSPSALPARRTLRAGSGRNAQQVKPCQGGSLKRTRRGALFVSARPHAGNARGVQVRPAQQLAT